MKILLNNITELNKLVAGLKDGESLVINEHGNISRGKLSQNIQAKLTDLPVKTVGKTPSDFDGNGLQEFYLTRSWVESPGKAFKNHWDKMRVKKFKAENLHPIYELFLEKMDNITIKESEKITVNFYEENGHKLMEINLPSFPCKVVLSVKYLTMWYYIFNGKKTAV